MCLDGGGIALVKSTAVFERPQKPSLTNDDICGSIFTAKEIVSNT